MTPTVKTPSVSRRAALAGSVGVGGALVGLTASALKSGPDSVRTRADSRDWPLVNHDTRNTGFNPHAAGPATDPDVRWQADRFDPEERFRGYLNLPTPAIVGETVFVGGSSLSALRVGDGRERWSLDGAADETFHGAAHADETVFVATRYPDASGVSAVESAGERRWRREVELRRIQPPLVAGETVYAPGYSFLVALNRSSGSRRWRLDTESLATAHPAVTDDALYTPMGWKGLFARDRRRSLLAIPFGNAPDARWRYEPEERAFPAPAVGDDGRIFVPETEEWHPHNDENQGVLAALDSDGTRRWTKLGGTFGTSPVVADGTVFYKCGANTVKRDMGEYVESHSDARITAHDPSDGDVRWTRNFEHLGDWQISPTADGDRLYVPLHDDVDERSALVALDADTGETAWRRKLKSPAYHLALAGETLYVSTEEGTLFAFE